MRGGDPHVNCGSTIRQATRQEQCGAQKRERGPEQDQDRPETTDQQGRRAIDPDRCQNRLRIKIDFAQFALKDSSIN